MAFHAVRERLAESAWAVWSQFVPHGTDGWSFVVGLGWGIVIALGVALVVGMYLDTQSAATDNSDPLSWQNSWWTNNWDKQTNFDRQQEQDDQWCRQADDVSHPRACLLYTSPSPRDQRG